MEMTKAQIIEILDTEWGGTYTEALAAKPKIGWGWLEQEAKRITKTKAAGHKGTCFEDGGPCVCWEDEIVE